MLKKIVTSNGHYFIIKGAAFQGRGTSKSSGPHCLLLWRKVLSQVGKEMKKGPKGINGLW